MASDPSFGQKHPEINCVSAKRVGRVRATTRYCTKFVATTLCHWSVATTLVGIGLSYLIASATADPENGGPFRLFDERIREFLFAIRGGVIGAILGMFISSWTQLRDLLYGRKKMQFSLAELLLAVFLAALILLCSRGYLLIRDASPYDWPR